MLPIMKSLRCPTIEGPAFRTVIYRLAKALVFLSGVLILSWQIKATFNTFIQNRTSFAMMQKTVQSLVPPTIVFCPRKTKDGFPSNFLAWSMFQIKISLMKIFFGLGTNLTFLCKDILAMVN